MKMTDLLQPSQTSLVRGRNFTSWTWQKKNRQKRKPRLAKFRISFSSNTHFFSLDTEIPALRQYVYNATIDRRHHAIKSNTKSLLRWLESFVNFLSGTLLEISPKFIFFKMMVL